MSKKFLAKLLIFCMVFTMLPMSAFAATGDNATVGDVTYRVALDTNAVTVMENEQIPLKATVYQVTGDTESIINVASDLVWTSSNEAVATVSNGAVTGVKAGTATITASYKGAADYCQVTVNAVPAEAGTYTVTIDGKGIDALTVGKTLNLTADVVKNIGNGQTQVVSNPAITWEITAQNPEDTESEKEITVATVDKNGMVTGKAAGSAVITATYTVTTKAETEGEKDIETKYTANYTVYVITTTYKVSLDKSNVALEIGNADKTTAELKATVTADPKPAEGSILPSVVWTTSNPEVATVNTNGLVTATGKGTATITAQIPGIDAKATCTVTVTYAAMDVIFDAGTGEFAEGVATEENGTLKVATDNQGKIVNWPADPTMEDQVFVGWFDEAGKQYTAETEFNYISAGYTLTAKYADAFQAVTTPTTTIDGKVVANTTITGAVDTKAVSDNEELATGNNTLVVDLSDVVKKADAVNVSIAPETVQSMLNAVDSKGNDSLSRVQTVTIKTVVAEVVLNADVLQSITEDTIYHEESMLLNIAKTTVSNEEVKAAYTVSFTVGGYNVLPEYPGSNLSVKVTVDSPYAADNKPAKPFVYYFNELSNTLGSRIANAGFTGNSVWFEAPHFSTIVITERQEYTIFYKSANGTDLGQQAVAIAKKEDGTNDTKSIAATLRLASAFGISNFVNWNGSDGKSYTDGQTGIVLTDDLTLTAVTKTSQTTTTGGGGGSSSNVSIASKVEGGKVTVTPTRPTRGQTVTINVTANEGYKLDTLVVTDNKGNNVELTKVSDTKYTFVMPAGKVTVTPTFVKTDAKEETKDPAAVKRFSDVASGAWYAEYITYVTENALMNGYDDGRFGPNDQTTRAQIVTVLYRLEGEPATRSSNSFSDVSAGGQYYSYAVAWAAINNIVNGYEDGRFGPNDNVTREQIAAILYRYATYKGYDTENAGSLAEFSDAAKVSSWANTAISWAVGEGLMNGDNGSLRPQGNATRAEIAALLMRFSENIAK